MGRVEALVHPAIGIAKHHTDLARLDVAILVGVVEFHDLLGDFLALFGLENAAELNAVANLVAGAPNLVGIHFGNKN